MFVMIIKSSKKKSYIIQLFRYKRLKYNEIKKKQNRVIYRRLKSFRKGLSQSQKLT